MSYGMYKVFTNVSLNEDITVCYSSLICMVHGLDAVPIYVSLYTHPYRATIGLYHHMTSFPVTYRVTWRTYDTRNMCL